MSRPISQSMNRRFDRLPVWAVALALLLGAPQLSRAQDADSIAIRHVLQQFAELWAGADATGLASITARLRISVRPESELVGPLQPRQVVAVLRQLFDEKESISLQPGEIRLMDGSPAQAFAEVVWSHRTRGTTSTEKGCLFLKLDLGEEGWRITEIRLLP